MLKDGKLSGALTIFFTYTLVLLGLLNPSEGSNFGIGSGSTSGLFVYLSAFLSYPIF
jgi:hypothetical protein